MFKADESINNEIEGKEKIFRSSRPEVLCEKVVLKNLKRPRTCNFFKKRQWLRYRLTGFNMTATLAGYGLRMLKFIHSNAFRSSNWRCSIKKDVL